MHHREVSPYRDMAIGGAPKLPRLRRPLVARVIFGTALAGSVVAVALGAPGFLLALVGSSGVALFATAGNRRRAVALRQLAALPFPITHSHASALEAHELTHRSIEAVTVRFVGEHAELVHAAATLAAWAPQLSVAVRATSLVITAWQWHGEDLLLLAATLDRTTPSAMSK
jgi:hypothetical protein